MIPARPDIFLDTTGLINPMPALRAKRAIDSMKPGQLIEILAADSAAKADIVYLSERLDLELIELSEKDGSVRITIRT